MFVDAKLKFYGVYNQFSWSSGGGFRYLLARLLGARASIDLALGPEQWAIYVVFGKSWLAIIEIDNLPTQGLIYDPR